MIEDQLRSSISSIPARFVLAPHHFARGHDQPVDEQGHEGVARRQAGAFDLQPARRDVAQRGRREAAAPLDPDGAAQFDAGHGAAFARLADQLAVEQGEHVDRLAEADARLAVGNPLDRPRWTLSGRQFDRDLVSGHLRDDSAHRRPERRNAPDRAVAALAGGEQGDRVERRPSRRRRARRRATAAARP